MKRTLFLIFFAFFATSMLVACAEKNSGEKRFYSECIKLNNEKIDKLILKMKQAYKRTIKSDGATSEERCKTIVKDINAWGVELNASEYRMNGFYDFLVDQMKKQL